MAIRLMQKDKDTVLLSSIDALAPALASISEECEENATVSVTAELDGGLYSLSEPFVLDAEKNPALKRLRLTVSAAEGEEPMITSLSKIPADLFSKVGDGIYKTNLPKDANGKYPVFRTLYNGASRVPMARSERSVHPFGFVNHYGGYPKNEYMQFHGGLYVEYPVAEKLASSPFGARTEMMMLIEWEFIIVEVTGVDLSVDMLSVAREECYERDITDILWLLQDMRSFELYGTVNAAVCCLDGINHLTGKGDVAKCFATVHNYLDPDGLFVFDVNTPSKFEDFYACNDYILEDEGVTVCWQNDYDKEKKICDFYLSVFEEQENGLWKRSDEVVRERCYSREELVSELERAGFEVIGFFGDFSFGEPSENCHRWYIAARCKKK